MKIGDFELLSGDILLYHGNDKLSNLIKCFDRAYYSHAAIYLGNGMIQESKIDGCKKRPLPLSFLTYNEVLVKRLENRCDLGRLRPVLKRARVLLDKEYDITQIIQLARHGYSNCNPLTYAAGIGYLFLLDKCMLLLGKKIINTDDRLQCAEFAYRCYNDAVKNSEEEGDRYTILLKNDRVPEGTNQKGKINGHLNSIDFKLDSSVVIPAIQEIKYGKLEEEILNSSTSEEEDFNEILVAADKFILENEIKKTGETRLITEELEEKIQSKMFEFRILAGAAMANHSRLKSINDMTYKDRMFYLNIIIDRGQYVTTKDLNQAKNLVNVVKFKPDSSRTMGDYDCLSFKVQDNPNEKTPCLEVK